MSVFPLTVNELRVYFVCREFALLLHKHNDTAWAQKKFVEVQRGWLWTWERRSVGSCRRKMLEPVFSEVWRWCYWVTQRSTLWLRLVGVWILRCHKCVCFVPVVCYPMFEDTNFQAINLQKTFQKKTPKPGIVLGIEWLFTGPQLFQFYS